MSKINSHGISRGSFLSSSQSSRFTKPSASKTTYRRATLGENNNNVSASGSTTGNDVNSRDFKIALNNAPYGSPSPSIRRKGVFDPTRPVSGNDPRWNKTLSKTIYFTLAATFVVFFLGIDSANNTTTIQLGGVIESEESDILSEHLLPHKIIKDHAMAEFTSRNEPIIDTLSGLPPPLPSQSIRSSYRSPIHPNTRERRSADSIVNEEENLKRLNGAANQLLNVLNQDEELHNNNVQLTITVNNNSNGNNKSKRSSGLRIFPGVPLPNQKFGASMLRSKSYKPSRQLLSRVKTYPHQISDLNCALYNGPEHNVAQEVIYWEDIPSDSTYRVPFFYDNTDENRAIEFHEERDSFSKYLTFQPDNGGWNNIRMSFETALVLSVAMGRTLVLPPKQQFPLLTFGSHDDQLIGFDDIFHLESLANEYDSVNIITMEEFIRREGLKTPKNRTNWDGASDLDKLWTFLEKTAYVPDSWNRNECIAAFPATFEQEGNAGLLDMLNDMQTEVDGRPYPHHLDFQGKPVRSNAPSNERIREMMAGRTKLCLYSKEMQSSTIIHLPTKPPHIRLLTHFYSFVFFESWSQSTWASRLVRDHLRYSDEIMCAAARVIDAIRQFSYSRENPHGIYHSLHVRRKKFYPDNQHTLSSEEVLQSLSDIEAGSTIFIASDDLDGDFFQPLQEEYNLRFLSDYKDLLRGLNPNYFGMIEQIVAARSDSFHGTFYSSFSAYINRLRGYYSLHGITNGDSNDGVLQNSFYMPAQYHDENRIYKAVQKPFYAREFPIAWRDINNGIDQMEVW